MNETNTGSITNFDYWKSAYAGRASNLSVSEVRALFAVVSRPEVVSLAGGMPDVSQLPTEGLNKAYDSLLTTCRDLALQYGGGQGDAKLREQIVEIMALEGISGSAEDLIVTTGSQHGLDLLADLFIDPGDVVLLESPSYVGAVGIFRHKQAEMVHLHTDSEGLSPEALQEQVPALKSQAKKVKLLYNLTT
jgi:Transcriptional regulators containing a DNA-binding HTH domain and an aminotransferase domain (MocR family) and their eukaryotic orthologs